MCLYFQNLLLERCSASLCWKELPRGGNHVKSITEKPGCEGLGVHSLSCNPGSHPLAPSPFGAEFLTLWPVGLQTSPLNGCLLNMSPDMEGYRQNCRCAKSGYWGFQSLSLPWGPVHELQEPQDWGCRWWCRSIRGQTWATWAGGEAGLQGQGRAITWKGTRGRIYAFTYIYMYSCVSSFSIQMPKSSKVHLSQDVLPASLMCGSTHLARQRLFICLWLPDACGSFW